LAALILLRRFFFMCGLLFFWAFYLFLFQRKYLVRSLVSVQRSRQYRVMNPAAVLAHPWFSFLGLSWISRRTSAEKGLVGVFVGAVFCTADEEVFPDRSRLFSKLSDFKGSPPPALFYLWIF